MGALRRGSPGAFVLVAQDEFAGQASAEEVHARLGVPVFAVREPARRGYFSVLAPYFEAVRWLAEHGVDYDWLVFLSGQDYPTQPLAAFERKLASETYDGYLRHWRAFDEVTPWGRRRQGRVRYGYHYFEAPRAALPLLRALRFVNGLQRLAHIHLVYGRRVGLRWPGSPFRGDVECWAGRKWSILRREAAEFATEAEARHDRLRDWFETTVCPCEAFVETVLVNSRRFRLCNDDLRYVDFTGSRDGRPRQLTFADLPELATPGYFFARKFDPLADPELLDRLDERIA